MAKTESIVHRVSPEDKAALVSAAREAGLSLTEFMVRKSLGRSVKISDVVKETDERKPPSIAPLSAGASEKKPKRDPSASCDRCTRLGTSEQYRSQCSRCLAIRSGKSPLDEA